MDGSFALSLQYKYIILMFLAHLSYISFEQSHSYKIHQPQQQRYIYTFKFLI